MSEKAIQVVYTDLIPLCPYCEKELNTINVLKGKVGVDIWKITDVFICPHCNKVISISTR